MSSDTSGGDAGSVQWSSIAVAGFRLLVLGARQLYSCEDERSQLYKITSCEHGSLLLKSILARAASVLVTAREIAELRPRALTAGRQLIEL